MQEYNCSKCGQSFRMANKPMFCPFCGEQSSVALNQKRARETALRLIAELNESDIPVLESIRKGYLEQWALVEYKRQTLRKYKQRGVITEEEMPSYRNPTVNEALKEYRRMMKEEKSSVKEEQK